MAERHEYYVDRVTIERLKLTELISNCNDLARKGFRLAAVAPCHDQQHGAHLLLFWERRHSPAD